MGEQKVGVYVSGSSPSLTFWKNLYTWNFMNIQMSKVLVILAIIASAFTNSQAQHSLQVDDGAGNYGIIRAANGGGVNIYFLPVGGGTLLTNANLAATCWVLGGNSLPASNIFGTTSATDIDIRTNNVSRVVIPQTGAFNLVQATSPTTGYQIGGQTILHNTGAGNVFVGVGSGSAITTGTNNSGYGAGTLQNNTTGYYNCAIGYHSLQNNTTGAGNTAAGQEALEFNTTGAGNVAIGIRALRNNTTGDNNTAIGLAALFNNTSGVENTAIGYALVLNTTGSQNTADGEFSLEHNTMMSPIFRTVFDCS